jgi:catechol 2,3-dioxygenase-like lactoylglutathione lyase family enzyme
METRSPVPPFTSETATQKVRMAEDAWNTHDPDRVVLVYTEETRWRNRAEFPFGREQAIPALDVAASVAFYRSMGFELIVDAPDYARFRSMIGSATFSIHAVDALAEAPKTVVYFECTALDQQVAELRARGLQFAPEPRDEPWLLREARLVDPSGNVICLYHAGGNRLNRPWRVGADPCAQPGVTTATLLMRSRGTG